MRKERKMIKVAKDLGWDVTGQSGNWCFTIFSPAGQENVVESSGETIEDVYQSIRDRGDGFDVSEEAYYWLDQFGQGKNGAPYDMRDVYNDMEWCQDKIIQLADAICEVI